MIHLKVFYFGLCIKKDGIESIGLEHVSSPVAGLEKYRMLIKNKTLIFFFFLEGRFLDFKNYFLEW